MRSFDLVILSDYGYGAISQELVDAITPDRKFVLVADPKPRSGVVYKGVDAITPNAKELYELTHDQNTERAGCTLATAWNTRVVVTQGADDTLLFSQDSAQYGFSRLGTETVESVDPCGAGDTFVAALACALASAEPYLGAIGFANKAAAVVVGKRGTAVVCPHELRGGDSNEV